MVAVVPDLRVVPQLQGESVARLQQQGGAVGRRVAALPGRLLVGDQLDLCIVFVENGAQGEVGGTVGCEADVVDSTDRCCEHTWRRRRRSDEELRVKHETSWSRLPQTGPADGTNT